MHWRQIEAPTRAPGRSQHSLAYHAASNSAIVFGGYSTERGFLGDVSVLNLDTAEAWQPADHGAFPAGRRGHVAEVAGDAMWVIGGAQAAGAVAEVYRLCLRTWAWSQV